MKFGLMFFASDENALHGDDRYRLVIDSARFGDRHGFSSVWVPERHFTPLGSLYPNPAVLHAALARETDHIGLRAGSVVLPLHNPLRVAEEWAVVDNLSGGRVGLSFASGWNPNDFAFFPDRYADRAAVLERDVSVVRRLWRGETIKVTSGTGDTTRVGTYPRPVQPELPVWFTAASNPATFATAGRSGANLLTHVLDQGVDRLAEQIATYRKARASAGWDPETGHVTVMLHTFVGPDNKSVSAEARAPYCAYLKNNIGLLKGLAASRDRDVDITALRDDELDDFVGFLYDRFVGERALIGSPPGCLPLARRLAEIGVDEVACLLDFGPTPDAVLAHLPWLDELRWLVDEECADSPRRTTTPITMTSAPTTTDTVIAEREPRTGEDLDTVRARCRVEIDGASFYRSVARVGAEYGPAMRCLDWVWVGDDEVVGRLELPDPASAEAFEFHPALLDNAFLLLGALAPGALAGTGPLTLPTGVRRLRLHRRPDGPLISHVVRTPLAEAPGTLVADVVISDENGQPVAHAEGLRMQVVERADGVDVAGPGELLYRTRWQEVSITAAPDEPSGRWLVLADGTGTGDALADVLTARGADVLLVRRGTEWESTSTGVTCDPSRPEHVRKLLAEAVAEAPLRGVVMLWPLDSAQLASSVRSSEVAAAQQGGVEAALAIVQGCLATDGGSATGRMWLVTRGAQGAGLSGVTPDVVRAGGVAHAPLWGFGRVIAAEHPGLWGGLIDLDPSEEPERGVAVLADVLLGDRAEDQVAVRGGRIVAPRLERARDLADAPTAVRIDPDGTYLLTGGLGDLGLAIARRLVEHGARHLVLTGREGLPAADGGTGDGTGNPGESVRNTARRAAVADLERRGATVQVLALDVADDRAVTALPRMLADAGLPAVAGVIHLAGVVRGSTLQGLDTAGLREVAAPKVSGGWNLHRTFGDVGLFLLISAVPAVIGPIGAGAANYAAANAFLDALAHHRRALGLAGTALGYGPWNELGLAVREEGLDQLAHIGVGSMAPDEALAVLDRVLAHDVEQVNAVRLDWPGLFGAFPHARGVAQLAAFAERTDTASNGLRERLAEAARPERVEILTGHLRRRFAEVLRTEPGNVDPERSVTAAGMDSLMSLDLRNRIQADLGVVVPMVSLLEGPTLTQLAEAVIELLCDDLDDTVSDGAGDERDEFTI